MYTLKLNLKARSYNIIIGSGIISALGKYLSRLNFAKDAYIITNRLIKRHYGRALTDSLANYGFNYKFKIIPDTEKSKDIKIAALVINDLAKFALKKRPFIIALGGGVVGDLSGFVASIYKRGIPYIQVPTTLLAQVDSSIGGKTAIDLSEGKNLVGAFYQPGLVLSDIALLKTLNRRQLSNGLAEAIKYGVIKDRGLFVYLEKKYKNIIKREEGALEYIVTACAKIKAGIVSLDEREEKGLRTALNFGHTIGHAIEAASGFNKYNHGEAVALGMLVASEISVKLNLIQDSLLKRIESLIGNAGLPVRILERPRKYRIFVEGILSKYYQDKKFIGSKNRFVLLSGLGRTKIVKAIPLRIIRWAIEKRF
ncbi:MAG: 3-dehydroquinate synthase [Candidatus Omnitrophica bacterium CG08_land_8_20_14_0_20_41_16]|uniref:3-dehydroquinate synthase n=1 Tax=Candidatus Sherwoodlollariibacterium unditelluris TaxID=1974757 RepID=A0A2G9YKR6_9BACT|nr:MAG: 3-dehydroquinate synthase [Candidatus Omnitrophica bacterium CG23_combo_of_CG06-09_8_20_14_all_41_10]PIS33609.1 MAG: 3-dehydroquinate synthase [Candidatus Omnitrophica bacterium CG08_land_8_20_14_0_20_41_16]